jgi:hypothetical protein
MVPAPMNDATFVAMPFRSRNFRYSASVVQSYSNLMSPCSDFQRFFISSVSGPIDVPSPKISSVTPWRISPSERPSAINDSVAHESMLMKPGATARPSALTSIKAEADPRSPIAASRSPRMPTSARTPGVPVPSYTRPRRMITS